MKKIIIQNGCGSGSAPAVGCGSGGIAQIGAGSGDMRYLEEDDE